jgi:thiamine-monophosphate kinase
MALMGGEDFELLFTAPPDRLDAVHEALDELGTAVSVVGTITDGDRLIDGRPLEKWSEQGWDHLRTR